MLNVNEIFQSIQGEGAQAGIPAVFLRLQGCNLRCPWCDTPNALDPGGGTVMSREKVMEQINQYTPNLVVVTGGEPLRQVTSLGMLINDMDQHKHVWALETNGTLSLPPVRLFDWITVSPKPPDYYIHPAYASPGQRISELKIVVTANDTLERIWNHHVLCPGNTLLDDTIICLQPVNNDLDIARKIVEFLCTIGEPFHQWRLSLQLHKILEVK